MRSPRPVRPDTPRPDTPRSDPPRPGPARPESPRPEPTRPGSGDPPKGGLPDATTITSPADTPPDTVRAIDEQPEADGATADEAEADRADVDGTAADEAEADRATADGSDAGSTGAAGPDPEVDTVQVLIEATTGAPVTTLPDRAPQRTGWPTPAAPGGGGPVQPSVPGHVEGIDEPAFWLPIEEVHWDGTPVRRDTEGWLSRWRQARAARHRVRRPPRPPHHPAVGLAGLVLFGLLASFFAWVTAEPLWLAVGRADRGVATVTTCTGHGLLTQCRGQFVAGTGWVSDIVPVVDVPAATRATGVRVDARMIGPDGTAAYAESGLVTRHLRWLLGALATLCCGVGIVWATGARRLASDIDRRRATAVALTGPVLVLVGFLVATL
ncbi:hypothetical protein [Plantactinospora sp. GCM10030261]|uniref:hypothetical protein n=1 Tax=Plantactinospora sp. GCM10030261 TaxID=3273420 RepID=UPI00361C4C13